MSGLSASFLPFAGKLLLTGDEGRQRAIERIQEEKRRFPRLQADFPAEVTFFDAVDFRNLERPCHALTRDISGGGAGMTFNKLYRGVIAGLRSGKVNMFVELRLPLVPDSVRARARTAWMREDGPGEDPDAVFMGIDFVDINDEDQVRINRYVLERLSER